MARDDIDDRDRLDGGSSTATLDHTAQTLTFEHRGSVATDEQKALSPLVVPLGAIAAVEYTVGRSTNWFWVVRRGREPWRKGVWRDPCGVVSGVDPTDFAERVRSAVMRATPLDADDLLDADPVRSPSPGWRARLAKGLGRAVVDGFFNTR